MSDFDFENSTIPSLTPLGNSFAYDDAESGLKAMFMDLFTQNLGSDTFDAFVLGTPHLGSFELVKKAINKDGISLLQSSSEETATRYLLRAWRSGDVQKRGLYLLKLYLVLQYGSSIEANQMQQLKTGTYPEDMAIYNADDGITDGYFLTSRVQVSVDYSLNDKKSTISNIQSVCPARFVPDIQFSLVHNRPRTDMVIASAGTLVTMFVESGALA